jgi:hypothetical protein
VTVDGIERCDGARGLFAITLFAPHWKVAWLLWYTLTSCAAAVFCGEVALVERESRATKCRRLTVIARAFLSSGQGARIPLRIELKMAMLHRLHDLCAVPLLLLLCQMRRQGPYGRRLLLEHHRILRALLPTEVSSTPGMGG